MEFQSVDLKCYTARANMYMNNSELISQTCRGWNDAVSAIYLQCPSPLAVPASREFGLIYAADIINATIKNPKQVPKEAWKAGILKMRNFDGKQKTSEFKNTST